METRKMSKLMWCMIGVVSTYRHGVDEHNRNELMRFYDKVEQDYYGEVDQVRNGSSHRAAISRAFYSLKRRGALEEGSLDIDQNLKDALANFF